jgi:hypothetical protein
MNRSIRPPINADAEEIGQVTFHCNGQFRLLL